MKIFFDTEFIEDGKTIELISIGAVREDSETFYAEVQGVDYARASTWVQHNVIAKLIGGNALMQRHTLAYEFFKFCGPNPEFWAYYADYDWVVLCQLYGRMVDLPTGWPMYCHDIIQLWEHVGATGIAPQTEGSHNALADALWNKQTYEAIMQQVEK